MSLQDEFITYESLEDGFITNTTIRKNDDGKPIYIEHKTYKNEELFFEKILNITYENGEETINYTKTDIKSNTTISGTHTKKL